MKKYENPEVEVQTIVSENIMDGVGGEWETSELV